MAMKNALLFILLYIFPQINGQENSRDVKIIGTKSKIAATHLAKRIRWVGSLSAIFRLNNISITRQLIHDQQDHYTLKVTMHNTKFPV